MDERDIRVRNFLYGRFVESGEAPQVADVARKLS
jgi:hypothetical protein